MLLDLDLYIDLYIYLYSEPQSSGDLMLHSIPERRRADNKEARLRHTALQSDSRSYLYGGMWKCRTTGQGTAEGGVPSGADKARRRR